VLQCHQDFQWKVPAAGSWSQGPLFQYVAGYVTKMAEGWNDDWLDDQQTPWQMADKITKQWTPWEPMMMAILARISFVHTNATTLVFECPYPPRPGCDLNPMPEVELYRTRNQEQSGLTLLEWRRRVVITGSKKEGWRAHLRVRGDSLVLCGVMHCSPHKDAYFYQWLLVHVVHRHPHELIHNDAYQVHPDVFWFCCAVRLRPAVWSNDAGVRQAFRHDGHAEEFIRNLSNRHVLKFIFTSIDLNYIILFLN
jgi:hypothetical protein